VRLVQVRVTQSEVQSSQLEVGAWEVDVLRVIHGPQNVEVVGESSCKRDYPDPAAELDRLHRRYGARNDEGGTPVNSGVSAVYGVNGAERIAEIIEREQSIEDGTYEEPAPKPARVAKPAPVRVPKKAANKAQVSEIDE
jgi:hypothetical protein